MEIEVTWLRGEGSERAYLLSVALVQVSVNFYNVNFFSRTTSQIQAFPQSVLG